MLNKIIERGCQDATLTTSDDITLDKILDEKAVEFYGEGQRYFDLIRNKKEIVRYRNIKDIVWQIEINVEAQVFDRDAHFAIMPIPQSEINANSNVCQNPGYQGYDANCK